MTDINRLANPLPFFSKLPAGSAVIIRHPCKKEQEKLIQSLKTAARRFQIKLLVSQHMDLAIKYHLDGLHLPEKQLHKYRQSGRMKRPYPNFLVTCATHNEISICTARKIEADYLFISPVFGTKSHPTQKGLGVMKFQQLARKATPVKPIALGGMTPSSMQRLSHCLNFSLAGISFTFISK